MRINATRLIASLFALEAIWFVLSTLVRLVDGFYHSDRGILAAILWPAVLGSAAWFLWRQQPPTLLLAAVARTVVVGVALLTNLLLVTAIASGHFGPLL